MLKKFLHLTNIKRHQLVVLHPTLIGASRSTIQQVQQGANAADPSDDVMVLCYISIGEDLRTTGLDDAQFAADWRFRGNGQGPRVDPRGPWASGAPLTGTGTHMYTCYDFVRAFIFL